MSLLKMVYTLLSILLLPLAIALSLSFGLSFAHLVDLLPPWGGVVIVLAGAVAISRPGAFWPIVYVLLGCAVGLGEPICLFCGAIAKYCLYFLPVLLWVGVWFWLNKKKKD